MEEVWGRGDVKHNSSETKGSTPKDIQALIVLAEQVSVDLGKIRLVPHRESGREQSESALMIKSLLALLNKSVCGEQKGGKRGLGK